MKSVMLSSTLRIEVGPIAPEGLQRDDAAGADVAVELRVALYGIVLDSRGDFAKFGGRLFLELLVCKRHDQHPPLKTRDVSNRRHTGPDTNPNSEG